MDGREKTPEEEAQAIINSSDESVEDLTEGTEVDLDDDQMEALVDTGGDREVDYGHELDF